MGDRSGDQRPCNLQPSRREKLHGRDSFRSSWAYHLKRHPGHSSSIFHPKGGPRGFPIRSGCEIQDVSWHSRRRGSVDPIDSRGHWEADAEMSAHEIALRGFVRRQPLFEEGSQVVHSRLSSSSRRSPMFRDFLADVACRGDEQPIQLWGSVCLFFNLLPCKCPVPGHFSA